MVNFMFFLKSLISSKSKPSKICSSLDKTAFKPPQQHTIFESLTSYPDFTVLWFFSWHYRQRSNISESCIKSVCDTVLSTERVNTLQDLVITAPHWIKNGFLRMHKRFERRCNVIASHFVQKFQVFRTIRVASFEISPVSFNFFCSTF